jgi:hypothetical protein
MRCKEAAAHGIMAYVDARMADKCVAMAALAQHAGAIKPMLEKYRFYNREKAFQRNS